MVDFNRYRCRNCKHWHMNPFTRKAHTCGVYYKDRTLIQCGCENFESNDNLIYLESLSE